ncbi:hypothetical protein GX586_09540 [bacterium]|nr:hypothetical protein [bacterium]
MKTVTHPHTRCLAAAVTALLILASFARPVEASTRPGPFYTEYERDYLRALTVIYFLYWRICVFAPGQALSEGNGSVFMDEHGRDLVRLCAPQARLAHCEANGLGSFTLRARIEGTTNALDCRVALRYGADHLLESVVFDQPVTLSSGRVAEPGTPVAIATVMQACALARKARTMSTPDLTVMRASFGGSYASPDYLKATSRGMVYGRAPTTYTSFDQITSISFSPFPLFGDEAGESNTVVITCEPGGIKKGRYPAYIHYFAVPGSGQNGARPELYAGFAAAIYNGELWYKYKVFLRNKRGDVIDQATYEQNRAQMAATPPLSDLRYGRYILDIDGEQHTAENVPVRMRASKRNAGGKKVKERGGR